jgi:PAS domain S-box-containing protein
VVEVSQVPTHGSIPIGDDGSSPPEHPVPPPKPIIIQDYQQVYEAVALPVLIIDHTSWLILAVNDAALRQYGYTRDEFVGMSVLEVRPPEGQAEARKVMSELPHGFWKATAVQHRRADGSRFTADVWSCDTVVDGRPVRIATIHEVTERVQLQRELQQAQKMEVVGRLAGGVAHDFNNALTTIISGAHLLLGQYGHDPEAKADLEAILKAADRAALLTRHLLAFSRQQVMRAGVISLTDVIARCVELLERVLEPHTVLRSQVDPASWPVQVDAIQFEQVIVNMAVNAQDAMPTGGTLVLETANITVSAQEAMQDPSVPAGDYAVVSVSDTGVGMDEITRARVFEPFFTTKPPPAGTGLGLSMAYGIVRQSGGYLTVESAPGAGTTFRIYLPRADRPSAATPGGVLPASPVARLVLIVDGDEGVRRSTGRVLEEMGYVPVFAASAREALHAIDATGVRPTLLVSSLTLPGMDGRELADRVQATVPDVGVLFLSGYAMEGDDDLRDVTGGRRLLKKPFSVESLIEAVRQVDSGG